MMELPGANTRIRVNENLSLTVFDTDGRLMWETSQTHTPVLTVKRGKSELRRIPLKLGKAKPSRFDDGKYRGQKLLITGFEDADIELELTFAIDSAEDELLIQAAQTGGMDAVVDIEHLYTFEKPISGGGYMVLPHGSGYLIPAECPDELPGEGHKDGYLGARWTLPMFGMVRGDDAMCAIVETWWDCEVEASHKPGDGSALSFHWRGSLGKLAYPRRFLLRFSRGMDYVSMAKIYREYARRQGTLRTLEEKSSETPSILHDISSILFRWPAWNPNESASVLGEVQFLREMGFNVKFFFPKWSSRGYSPERGTATTADAGWQAFLLENPVPGGWESLVEFADAVRKLGCTIQGFVNPRSQHPEAPEFDEARWPRNAEGQTIHDLSVHDAFDRIKRGLDNLEARGLKYDALYYDGYSAYHPLPQDFSPEHSVTRRMTYEAQNECFAETRRRGITAAAELARFWCIPYCDYFFFTDWSSDRLCNTPVQGALAPVGEPIPLFQLVFHDCYMAGFSGGGYSVYSPGYDWWEDRTPRLYELLFASAPAYNWLPDGSVPVGDLSGVEVKQRLTWLKRWSAYYRSVATSEMVSHRFLSPDRKIQKTEFANGAIAIFNMATNEFRIINVADSSGEWEKPEEL